MEPQELCSLQGVRRGKAPEDRKLDNAGPWDEQTGQAITPLSPLLRTVSDLTLHSAMEELHCHAL